MSLNTTCWTLNTFIRRKKVLLELQALYPISMRSKWHTHTHIQDQKDLVITNFSFMELFCCEIKLWKIIHANRKCSMFIYGVLLFNVWKLPIRISHLERKSTRQISWRQITENMIFEVLKLQSLIHYKFWRSSSNE